MEEKPLSEEYVDDFFIDRKFPSRSYCDEIALSISGASAVFPVSVPGSLSYTVVCTKPRKALQHSNGDIVMSFRQLESGFHKDIVELAGSIHGHLVPRVTYHGMVAGSDPPLAIYTMPLLPGVACLEMLSCEAVLSSEEEAKYLCFVKNLAWYFARCWLAPQAVESHVLAEHQAAVSRRLSILSSSSTATVPKSTLSELEAVLPTLFSDAYPQVLTHNDLSATNVLVDLNTYEITGIVDWSPAGIQPFGFELDWLFFMTGFMDTRGWHYYSCHAQLEKTFWDEFWIASGLDKADNNRKTDIQGKAETAAKIGAVLRYAFARNPDGSPSEVPTTCESMLKYLEAFLFR